MSTNEQLHSGLPKMIEPQAINGVLLHPGWPPPSEALYRRAGEPPGEYHRRAERRPRLLVPWLPTCVLRRALAYCGGVPEGVAVQQEYVNCPDMCCDIDLQSKDSLPEGWCSCGSLEFPS